MFFSTFSKASAHLSTTGVPSVRRKDSVINRALSTAIRGGFFLMPFSILSTLARFDLASEEVNVSSSLFSILSSWADNIGDKRGILYLPLFENRRAILRK
jgi:hypothetical protein